ncbi:MAG: translesion DNA synthesis-associated protein ImuA [Spongiibacteraceae bacterium]
MKNAKLDQLFNQRRLWLAKTAAPQHGAGSVSTGFDLLDQSLHHGGWPRNGSTEILYQQDGIGELWLLIPALRTVITQRPIAWLNPPYTPYPNALQQQGLASNQQLILHPQGLPDQLWAAEECLRSGAVSAVLCWFSTAKLSDRQLRRLHIAARDGDCWHIHFRPLAFEQQISPAPLRLCLTADNHQLAIKILKQNGGHAGQKLQLERPIGLYQQQLPVTQWPVYTRENNRIPLHSLRSSKQPNPSQNRTPQLPSSSKAI